GVGQGNGDALGRIVGHLDGIGGIGTTGEVGDAQGRLAVIGGDHGGGEVGMTTVVAAVQGDVILVEEAVSGGASAGAAGESDVPGAVGQHRRAKEGRQVDRRGLEGGAGAGRIDEEGAVDD